MKRNEIVKYIERINDYWISTHEDDVGTAFWERGAYNIGNIEAYKLTSNDKYLHYSEKWAVQNKWMGNRNKEDKSTWTWGYSDDPEGKAVLFGDWQTCFQTYIDLYLLDSQPDPAKISRTLEVMEYQIQ